MIDSYLFNLELNCLGFIYLLRIIVWSFCFFLVFLHSGMFGRRNTDIKHLPFQQNIPDTASRFLLHRREAIPATHTHITMVWHKHIPYRDGKIHRFASMHRHKSSRCDGPDQKSVHRIQCGMNRDASFLTFLHRYNPLYLYRIVCRRTPFNI